MSFHKIILFVVFILSVDIQNTASLTSDLKFNYFHKNTNIIHEVMNKLFKNLKLNKSFNQSIKNRLLLTMHQDLITIVKNNYKVTKFDYTVDKKPVNEFSYYNMLDVLLRDDTILFQDNTTNIKDTIEKNIDSNLLIYVSKYLNQFISRIIFRPENVSNEYNSLDTNVQTNRRNSTRKRINLKPWVPAPNSIEELTFNSRRVFDGQPTSIKKFPFMASIHVEEEFVCAGSIIAKRLVITAASCLQVAYVNRHYKNPTNVAIRIGADTTQGGELISVIRIHFHPSYDPERLHDNLAILKTARHKVLKGVTIRRVLFDRSSDPLPEDVKIIKMLGWGAKTEKNLAELYQKLSAANLEVYDQNECVKVYTKYYVSDLCFCAGFSHKGSGACSKDLGAPATISGVLVGVVSFGPPVCGTPDAPTVFTRIGIYAPWIDSIIQLESQNTKKLISRSKSERLKLHTATEYPKSFLRKSPFDAIKYNYDYPEEMLILKEILKDVSLSNKTVIRNIIDEGFNRELIHMIETTTKLDMIHSPLINKSYFPLDDFFPLAQNPKEPGYTEHNYLIHRIIPTTTKRHRHLLREGPEHRRPFLATRYDSDSGPETTESPKKRAKPTTKRPPFVGKPIDDYDYKYSEMNTGRPSIVPKFTKAHKFSLTESTERVPFEGKQTNSNDYDYYYPEKTTPEEPYHTTKRPPFVGKPINNNNDYEYLDKKPSRIPPMVTNLANKPKSNNGNLKIGKLIQDTIPLMSSQILSNKDHTYDNYESEYYDKGISIEVVSARKVRENEDDAKNIFFVVEANFDGSGNSDDAKVGNKNNQKNDDDFDFSKSFDSRAENEYSVTVTTDNN